MLRILEQVQMSFHLPIPMIARRMHAHCGLAMSYSRRSHDKPHDPGFPSFNVEDLSYDKFSFSACNVVFDAHCLNMLFRGADTEIAQQIGRLKDRARIICSRLSPQLLLDATWTEEAQAVVDLLLARARNMHYFPSYRIQQLDEDRPERYILPDFV